MIDVREIMEILPHRYPFLLIDRILEVDENGSDASSGNWQRALASALSTPLRVRSRFGGRIIEFGKGRGKGWLMSPPGKRCRSPHSTLPF